MQPPTRMASQIDPDEARRNWVGWVLWYKATHEDELPTKTELARRLGVTKGAVTQLLDLNTDRKPSFDTLIYSSNLTGFSVDSMLRSKPPTSDVHPRRR